MKHGSLLKLDVKYAKIILINLAFFLGYTAFVYLNPLKQ